MPRREIISNNGEFAVIEGESPGRPDQGPTKVHRKELTREEFLEAFPVGEPY
jgi:hypothetical protein